MGASDTRQEDLARATLLLCLLVSKEEKKHKTQAPGALFVFVFISLLSVYSLPFYYLHMR